MKMHSESGRRKRPNQDVERGRRYKFFTCAVVHAQKRQKDFFCLSRLFFKFGFVYSPSIPLVFFVYLYIHERAYLTLLLVLYILYIHERISLYCQDQKMAGFLLNKKMDTSLESAFRDLHIDATTGALF